METTEKVAAELRELRQSVSDLTRQVEKSVSETVREHPRAVLGGLLGLALVALFLAMLFRRDK